MAPGVASHLMQCCLRIVYHLVIFVLFDFYFRQHAWRTNQVCENYLEEGKGHGPYFDAAAIIDTLYSRTPR